MKFKWGIFLASAVFSSAGFSSSNVCTSYPGIYICENGKVENISGLYGSVIMEHVEATNIKGTIGALDMKESVVKHVRGNIGAFIALSSTILEKIEGNLGTILLKKSIINEIVARNSDLELDDSKIEKITLSSKEKEVKINLKNRSIVTGDIIFSENSGLVCIDESSELRGSLTNGKTTKGSC